MYDIIEKIFAVILAVILMFFFPLLDSFERMDDLAYMSIYSATVQFVDTVKNTGKITPTEYMNFMQIIESTGNKYSVELLHRQLNVFPRKDNVTANGDSFEYVELYDEYYTYQILSYMNIMEWNESNGKMEYTNENTDKFKNYDSFKYGDYFYVCVKNTTPTAATIIKSVLYGSSAGNLTIVVPYGGMIRNEIIEL